ncbi:MAG: response regulator [Bacteroidales bacterium]|nr:response regulator [Bacteroidales bacterium]MBN2820063.1 response regulator [Bacteroidales bacterium]
MSYKVLIVDDNINNSRLIEGILSVDERDFDCHFAENGAIAYEKAKEIIPDLILMDLLMPEVDGIEALKLLQKHNELREIPVILITAYKTNENFKLAFDEGAFDFITKPIDINELRSRINKALGVGETLRRIKIKIGKYKQQRKELEKKAVLAQNVQNSFIVTNYNGEIDWANDGFQNMHGLSIENHINKFGRDIKKVYNDDDISQNIDRCFNEQIPISFTIGLTHPDKTEKWLQVFISPQLTKGNNIEKLIIVESDITELKVKEKELNEQNIKMLHITENLENANSQLENQRDEINLQKIKIEEEQEKSERLLLNILPFEVARQLKSKGKAGTRFYKHVSVMFGDFKGFSKLSKELEPKTLVSYLDDYFIRYDEIIGAHYLEKIKTIGDAYMCAGGLPLRNNSHPVDAVLAGLEIQHTMHVINNENAKNNVPLWELRIGVHTGPVVAGVVGNKKFAYDIWGDTVNVAARMQERGEVGKVNVSGETYEHIKDYFFCEYRGKIEAKNVGKIDMYFVNRLKPEFTEDKLGLIPNEEFKLLVNKL